MVTEEDLNRIVKGPNDLEERIEQLIKQKEILKSACKEAGRRIEELERDNQIFRQDIDRLTEDKHNLEILLKK